MNSADREEYIKYQLDKSKESFKAAEILAENKLWTSVMNRLYYACFYVVNALLVKNEIQTKTHAGMKNQFALHFIKTGKLGKHYGELFSDLFDWRHQGDYGGVHEFNENEVIDHIPLVSRT